jgi:hypothetical protein
MFMCAGRGWEEVGYVRGAWGEGHGEKDSIVIRRGIVILRYSIGMSELPSRSHALPCISIKPCISVFSVQLTHTGLIEPFGTSSI